MGAEPTPRFEVALSGPFVNQHWAKERRRALLVAGLSWTIFAFILASILFPQTDARVASLAAATSGLIGAYWLALWLAWVRGGRNGLISIRMTEEGIRLMGFNGFLVRRSRFYPWSRITQATWIEDRHFFLIETEAGCGKKSQKRAIVIDERWVGDRDLFFMSLGAFVRTTRMVGQRNPFKALGLWKLEFRM